MKKFGLLLFFSLLYLEGVCCARISTTSLFEYDEYDAAYYEELDEKIENNQTEVCRSKKIVMAIRLFLSMLLLDFCV